jgi:homoserine O-acetyltransferase
MQTFQWMVSYPNFMDKAIPIMGSPKQTSYDLLLWTAEIQDIEADPAWNGGDYTSPPPAGMKTVADIHYLALTTPQYLVEHTAPQDFLQYLEKIQQDTMKDFDANNWIRQAQAMIDLDVSKPFGQSMEKAAATVLAQVLVIVGIHDHMVNPTPGLNFARLLVAPTLELASDCGHLSSGCEAAKVDDSVARFLDR